MNDHEHATTESVEEEVGQFVRDCLRESQLNMEVRCHVNEDQVTVTLDGEDADIVLRENARLLYAVNHLLNQAFFRRYQRRYHYLVDCEDFRSSRVMELRLLAEKAAERVVATGQPFNLQPMPSSERRVIHLKLADLEGVRTISQGTGRYRRVLIEPDK